jgi:hypothetical protein
MKGGRINLKITYPLSLKRAKKRPQQKSYQGFSPQIEQVFPRNFLFKILEQIFLWNPKIILLLCRKRGVGLAFFGYRAQHSFLVYVTILLLYYS